MKIVELDPQGHCEQAAVALQNRLMEEGQSLAEQKSWQQALAVMFNAYSLSPGKSPILRAIAEVYSSQGDEEAARTCRLGVVPESAEAKFFNSTCIQTRFKAATEVSNTRHIQVHHPENIALKFPRTNESSMKRPQFKSDKTDSRGSFVSILQQGGVWFDGFNTVVLDNDGNIVRDHVKGNAFVVVDSARRRPELLLEGRTCFLDARSSHIYYHWMIDVLPKFALLKSAGIDIEKIDSFVVRCRSSFQKQTLEHLGVPLDKVVNPPTDAMIRCDELIVPYLKNDRGERFYNGLGLGMGYWVSEWMKSMFIHKHSGCHRRLYISRAACGTRAVVREEELVKALERRDFHCVQMESLSVTEQAELLDGADVVVAPHGAGLTNIVFCKPGTVVVEIFGNYVVPCYWAISELAKLEYHAYFVNDTTAISKDGAKENAEVLDPVQRRDQGIDLALPDFTAYLDRLLP
ncbi:glycosyltransferase family 61 protein [Granulosicoccus antarcticus]|nr:glycosyltransferase family 61 protein [Granulosicoccus antarcticus]